VSARLMRITGTAVVHLRPGAGTETMVRQCKPIPVEPCVESAWLPRLRLKNAMHCFQVLL